MSDKKMLDEKLRGFPGNKFYRILLEVKEGPDLSEDSIKLHSLSGYYSNDYIPPAKFNEHLYYVISDESTFKSHACVGAVVLPLKVASEMLSTCEPQLESLCKDYRLESIHFAEIFGQKRILGSKQSAFLKDYVDIVSNENILSVAFSTNKCEFLGRLPFKDARDDELYFQLFWNIMERLAERLPLESILHLYFEQDNHLSQSLVTKSIQRLYDGIDQCEAFRENRNSICRHPLIFSKRALLFSSLSDLAAYSNNVVQQKLDTNVPHSKIFQTKRQLIDLARNIFRDPISIHQSKYGASELIRM